MWPWLRDGFVEFFTDKTYFQGKWDRWVAKVRAAILAAGASFAFYSEKIEAAAPEVLRGKVRFAGIALMALALALRAGDKTPEELKTLAASMKP